MGTAGATHLPTTTADGVVVLTMSCWCRWKGGTAPTKLVTADDVRNGRTWSCGAKGCRSPIGQPDARTYTRKGAHAVLDTSPPLQAARDAVDQAIKARRAIVDAVERKAAS